MNTTKTRIDNIHIKLSPMDKERFVLAAKKISLTLSGYLKMCAAEKANKILESDREAYK
jgi:uncharacterized protein (DUF1778 family)